MEISFTYEPDKKITDEIYNIVKDYSGDFFTYNFPDEIIVDMKFQRTAYLSIGGEVVSVIVYTCFDGVPQVTLMATKRAHRSMGYGSILMNSLVEHLSEMGLYKMELYTHIPEKKPINSSSVAFYEHVGFVRDKIYPAMWEEGALKMVKEWERK